MFSTFKAEPIETKYHSNIRTNALLLPQNYLQTNQYTFADHTNTDAWYQPNRDYNYNLLNTNKIDTNKAYRKYMTNHNKEIIKYNTDLCYKEIGKTT